MGQFSLNFALPGLAVDNLWITAVVIHNPQVSVTYPQIIHRNFTQTKIWDKFGLLGIVILEIM